MDLVAMSKLYSEILVLMYAHCPPFLSAGLQLHATTTERKQETSKALQWSLGRYEEVQRNPVFYSSSLNCNLVYTEV